MTKHHLVNKCRGGHATPDNLLQLWNDKHEIWHVLFKNDSPEEIIKVLERMIRMKGRKEGNNGLHDAGISTEAQMRAMWEAYERNPRTTTRRSVLPPDRP